MPFLQTITSFFTQPTAANASASRQNRRSAMNSTFDAFDLPTTQRYGDVGGSGSGRKHGLGVGGLSGQTDSANPSPGPSRRGSYNTYPAAQDPYRPALTYFPPLSNTFHRLRNALSETFPELLETLNPPVDTALLSTFESTLGCPLPPPVRESFLIADGQDTSLGGGGIFFGLYLLSLEEVIKEWTFWRSAEHDPSAGTNPAVLATMASVPPAWIKSLYACRGWIPLISDRTGNYIGVDLDPGTGGNWGQVIIFGRDFDRKCVLWKGEGEGGWGRWMGSFVDELESGEGWEADRANSSDEEEEAGYGDYSGGGSYGEAGKGLRLAGEYRGWSVLEAWWDRSVRRWEAIGLGLDVEGIEKGLEEARRLTGYENGDVTGKAKGKGKEREAVHGLGIGMRTGESSAQVEIPVLGSPQIPQAPSTPVPRDSDVLLPPSSPEHPPFPSVPRIQHHPVRMITPLTTTDHPLKPKPDDREQDIGSGYLSPPSRSPPRNRQNQRHSTHSAPPVTSLDLPTRADVQAMHAIAKAETTGLRGGWVMNLDTPANARKYRNSSESEMVDIDLEGGKGEKFGSPRISIEESEKRMEEERMGIEHVRSRSPALAPERIPSPSPLSRETSWDGSMKTPKAVRRESYNDKGGVPASVLAATTALRRPPPIANSSFNAERPNSPMGRFGEMGIGGGGERSRTERESSILSVDSQDGLLGGSSGNISRSGTPPVDSPTTIHGSARSSAEGGRRYVVGRSNGVTGARVMHDSLDGLEDGMEDVSFG